MGVVMPATLKPAPLAAACEIVTLAFPELVSVTGNLLVLPTTALPKEMLVGLAVNVAFVATPAPERARVCGELGALSVKTMLPFAEPETVGAN
jgi:hypothetical protein